MTAKQVDRSRETLESGDVNISETYRVNQPDSTAANAPGIPSTIDGLPVRRVSVRRVSQNITDVTITASNLTGGSISPVDVTNTDRAVWGTATVNIENKIPYATGVTNRIGTGITSVILGYWQRNEETITDDGQIVRLQIAEASFPSAAFQAIREQANNIHLINGRKYKFLSAQTTEIAAGIYSLTYEWLDDPGTAQVLGSVGAGDPTPVPGGDQIIWPGAGIPYIVPSGSDTPAGELMRMPFHRLVYIPGGTAYSSPSVLHAINGTPDDDGWLTLPGLQGGVPL